MPVLKLSRRTVYVMISLGTPENRDTWWRSCLRRHATSRKVQVRLPVVSMVFFI